MKEEIKEIRAAFERIGKLLDQMEGVPAGDLTPYVMEIKDESQAERALAAARKLGCPIDEDPKFGKYRANIDTHFITKKQGSGFYNHNGRNRTPITLEDFEKLAGIDPLEGKAVEGFSGGKNIGLNNGEHHLWYSASDKVWKVMHDVSGGRNPHHLTRVAERTVGRFYLIEGQDGSQPFHFGLFLGDKYVGWANSEHAPFHVYRKIEKLTMYEVTPTV